MNAPRVSIVLPTYNRLDLLRQALASIRAQTYTDYEIVVVDDGSTDGTRAWMEANPNDTLVYLRQENAGVSTARNAGIRAARGELLAFLDDDDLWLPAKLERQVPLFDNPDVGFVFCGNAYCDASGRIEMLRVPGPEYRGHAVPAMLRRNMMPTPSVMVRRRLALEAGVMYEDLVFGEDWNYWLRIAARCKVDYVPEILVHFREMPGGLSRLPFDAFRTNTLALFEGIFRDPESARLLEPYRREALSQAHARVAEEALHRGRLDVARKEAWQALRLRSGNRIAWRVLPRALLGRRFLDALRGLR